MPYIRPARSSSFSDPEEVEPTDDDEARWLDEQDCIAAARPEPQDAAPTGPVARYQQVWTHEQILDCDDIASYMDYVWEMTNNSEEY